MITFKIIVADVVIDVATPNPSFFEKRFKDYICHSDSTAQMHMETLLLDMVSLPLGDVLYSLDNNFVVKITDNQNCFYTKSPYSDDVLFAVYHTLDYSSVKIEINKNINYNGLDALGYEYMFTNFMFANRLVFLGGTVLHSSAIAYKNHGIAFTAPSGTGKSTHTRLWREKFGEDVVFINDDKPAIRFFDNKPYIYGTPWSGKTDINNNIKAPLSAIVCLQRGEANSIHPIDTALGVLYLSRQLTNPYHDANIGKLAVDNIKKLFDAIPILQLKCNISENAVDTVFNAVMRENLNEN